MGFIKEDVEKLSAALGEPSWVLDARLSAFAAFETMQVPREKDEPWRYTNLQQMKFDLDRFAPSPPEGPEDLSVRQSSLAQENQDRGGFAVQVGSDAALVELRPDAAEAGVIFCDLNKATIEHEELVRKHLFTTSQPSHVFGALQRAFFCGGSFLYVPRGVTVALPVEAHRWSGRAGSTMAPHDLIVAEEGAEVVYFERLLSDSDNETLYLGNTEVIAGQASRVSIVTLQELNRSSWHFHTQEAVTGRDVSFRSLIVSLGGRLSRHEAGSVMKGSGCSIEMLGLYFAAGGQHFDFRTLQDHAADRCTSDLLYKGALTGDAHTVYSGLIHVRPEGAETDAYQTNRNLVLTDHARADSKPELEIENNDVRCSHAASVGQLNEEEIFYLRSRGIDRAEAETLIVNGFFEEVSARLVQPLIRSAVAEAIQTKLGS